MGREKKGGDKVGRGPGELAAWGRLRGAQRQMRRPALGGGREDLRAGPPAAQA